MLEIHFFTCQAFSLHRHNMASSSIMRTVHPSSITTSHSKTLIKHSIITPPHLLQAFFTTSPRVLRRSGFDNTAHKTVLAKSFSTTFSHTPGPQNTPNSSNSVTAKPHFTSHLEVEQKFLPTLALKQLLSRPGSETLPPIPQRIRDLCSGGVANSQRRLTFDPLSDRIIFDRYYDTKDLSLMKNGIYVRHRSHIAKAGVDGSQAYKGSMEAKVLLRGTHEDSACVELEGWDAIEEMLEERKLLHCTEGKAGWGQIAPICTDRSEWKVIEQRDPQMEMPTLGEATQRVIQSHWRKLEATGRENRDAGPKPKLDLGQSTITIVLDRASGPGGQDFLHEVGEVEMMTEFHGGETAGEHAELRLAAAEAMQERLAEFMRRHPALFNTGEGVKGKLKAYLESKDRKKSTQGTVPYESLEKVDVSHTLW
ncbi:hypothetical protein LTR56_002530 [Elasticomyces elasticus]|nr:hypothetical protein LTR22_019479 [Elasticomyces elasticus]KAK3657388.1 hypothetical protein LTR56_002530 [Elasticomyces elasticus]KAK4909455.1 hypothetical protein LTR49_021788 [Elasticomyces elasticus]KAK5750854.1 hypothetical protein LTS12_019065 [Elasticomyces elasticus]